LQEREPPLAVKMVYDPCFQISSMAGGLIEL